MCMVSFLEHNDDKTNFCNIFKKIPLHIDPL
ncbi:MAG: hypothetical protein E5299_00573 [Burkholderia gladioli]|nr:MAG: hypothetical protein E5299_00573 [Burkholderia gladioli]